MVRVVCISDTHTYQKSVELPHGDILVHAGDFTFRGRENEVRDFGTWFRSQPHTHKVVIAGNHDLSFEKDRSQAVSWLYNDYRLENDFHYLQDESVVVNVDGRDIKIYGSPWQPEFCAWAFNLPRGSQLKTVWGKIPEDTDILVTHSPPYSVLDLCDHGERVGCRDLYNRVLQLNIKLHVFGHIHEAHGTDVIGDTTFVNASNCTASYNPINKAIVVDI